ncbi:MAG: helicase-related protein [Phycisphaerales bacterium JB054]
MELIDNINKLLGDDLKQVLGPATKLKIAASCFSIFAYEALKEQLERVDSIEFLFTAPTFVPDEVTDSDSKQRREFHIPRRSRERNFYGSEFELQLKNKLTQRAIARECADWIRRKATFRSNCTTAPMQQFACVTRGTDEIVYQPLHGFTAVDLGYQRGDAVSNFVAKIDSAPHTASYLELFDQVWQDAERVADVTQRLSDHIAAVYQENSPSRIYFMLLFHIFNEFLEDLSDDVLPNDLTGYRDSLVWNKLYNFQRDAATGIINKLESVSGCILADSVGLGKTFTALAVVKYYELRNRSVLVLCPKKLADNWLNYNRNLKTNIFAGDRFNYDVLCHTDLQRTSGESFGSPLNRVNWGNYDLVIIDESHNFRNADPYKDRETRYDTLMRQVIREGVKTKVLMLSATPVNNRFNDLKNQLALAYEGDAEAFSERLGMKRDIDEVFRRAQATFNVWSKLPVEERTTAAILEALDFDFFELLDNVTIARSRKHIQTFYDTSEIGSFPERRKPLSYHPPLTSRGDVIGFNEIYARLSQLVLAIYAPVSYILPSRLAGYERLYDTEVGGGGGKLKQVDREKSLQSLMTVNLLKRLESSVEAFRITLDKLRTNHRDVLARIDTFRRTGVDSGFEDIAGAFANIDPDDDDELADLDDDSVGGKVKVRLADMDIESWEQALQGDIDVIEELLAEMHKVTPSEDAKLQHLKTQIRSKLASPINPGNKKVLIFTAFADTANYLFRVLSPELVKDQRVHAGLVTGTGGPKSTLKRSYDFQSLLTVFSPRSKEKALTMPDDPNEIDVLIATDCISEGQNLQDCDYLINYDIHWNPVRILQRFGRIDRIGSPNASIQLVNYWPDITLDEYINLKERVENRMVIADVTATGDDNVLTAKAGDVSYRQEQLRKLQEEVIEMEDLRTGVSITDLGLNDFRMDLLNHIKTDGDLESLPTGLHAVVPADSAIGLTPGVIFALRNRHQSVNVNQQNRLHPYYLVYVSMDGQITVNHMEVKRLLDLARAACRNRAEPEKPACGVFNSETDDGRDMSKYSGLLSRAIRSIVDLKEDKDLDSLFTGKKTTALTTQIAGLDDFELVVFIAVVETP